MVFVCETVSQHVGPPPPLPPPTAGLTPFVPPVWSRPPLHIAFLPSLVRAPLDLAAPRRIDTKAAGRRRHPGEVMLETREKLAHPETAGTNGEHMGVLLGTCFKKTKKNLLLLNHPANIGNSFTQCAEW